MLASFATAVPEVNLRDELFFTRLRADEFSRLDAGRHAYLDYTGSALYAERQVRRGHAYSRTSSTSSSSASGT